MKPLRLAKLMAVGLVILSASFTPTPAEALGIRALFAPVVLSKLQKLARATRKEFKSNNLLRTQGKAWHTKYGYDPFIFGDPINGGARSKSDMLQAVAKAKAKASGSPVDWVNDVYLPYAEYLMSRKGTEPSIGDYLYGNCSEMATINFEELYRTRPGLDLAIVGSTGNDHCVLLVRSPEKPDDIYVVDSWWHDGVVIGPCKIRKRRVDCTGKAGADPKYHGSINAPYKWYRSPPRKKKGSTRGKGRH